LTVDALPEALTTGALVLEDCSPEFLDERALFHLLNLVREDDGWLLLTTRAAPTLWTVALPDLASRLRAMPVASLDMPDDALLRAVIVKLFADRQLAVDEALIGYLLPRIGRSFAAARDAVDTLDREALQRGRPVNRTLAAELYRKALS
jgi:chromosomal replication initiation ATPase DnaA